MNNGETSLTRHVLLGLKAGLGPNRGLEAVAVELLQDIEDLRADGGLPAEVHTAIAIRPQQQLLEIRVEGLSVAQDPDRTTIRDVMNSVFELASYYNVACLDGVTPPLFTLRILLVDPDGRPFSALIGTAVGDVEATATAPADPSLSHRV